jgi:hypothetical protein
MRRFTLAELFLLTTVVCVLLVIREPIIEAVSVAWDLVRWLMGDEIVLHRFRDSIPRPK